ncbi:MAG TPA: tartrate dehydrogenase [Pirellulales bacterium]|jgi:tartrate dehydrogenase/decarboxylase/D-malate dehydrogenase
MKTLRIAVYPGDGIGPEVIRQAVRVLRAVEARQKDWSLELTEFPWGAAYHRQTGRVVPEDFLEVLRPFDAILLGAVGWPAELPDHVTLAPLVTLRQRFDQYACVRPAKLFAGLRGLLADKGPADIDLVVVRENSEGEYVDNGGRVRRGTSDEYAVQTAIHTRRGIERVLRFGYELARTRRNKLTMITKSNAQRHAYVLWDDVLDEVSPQFPDVSTDKQHADAAAMNLVRRPETFDVIVASNLFGDILTDLAGTIAGGLGLAPSTNTNPERKFPSMFEPVHGSAPDIAGQGIANPIAAVLSAAMMMDWLGAAAAGNHLRGAVERTLAAGHKTVDLGGRLSTEAMGDLLVAAVEQA